MQNALPQDRIYKKTGKIERQMGGGGWEKGKPKFTLPPQIMNNFFVSFGS